MYDVIIGACGTILKGTKDTFIEFFAQGANTMKLCQQATGNIKDF